MIAAQVTAVLHHSNVDEFVALDDLTTHHSVVVKATGRVFVAGAGAFCGTSSVTVESSSNCVAECPVVRNHQRTCAVELCRKCILSVVGPVWPLTCAPAIAAHTGAC